MLLAIDVGNTNISFGVFDGDVITHEIRSESSRTRTADEYTVLLRQLLAIRGIEPRAIDAAILASVVPQLTDVLSLAVRRGFARDPIVFGQGTRTGMPILYENPRELGADRIVNAVAAYARVKAGVIVVDFGTATKVEAVSPKGEYLGGAIAPGLRIAAEALFENASRLRTVALDAPKSVVGKSSAHSIQSGMILGYAGLVDGLVDRMRAEVGFPCRVLATGGVSTLIAPHTRTIQETISSLTLEGLRLLYERNRS
jgi:type III pantothenate kinase